MRLGTSLYKYLQFKPLIASSIVMWVRFLGRGCYLSWPNQVAFFYNMLPDRIIEFSRYTVGLYNLLQLPAS